MPCFVSTAGLLTLLVVLLMPVPAKAAPQTVAFSGTIDTVTDPGGFLDPSIQAGSPLTGSYTVDPANATSGLEVGSGTGYGAAALPYADVSATVANQSFNNPVQVLIVSNGRDFSAFGPGFGIGDGWVTAFFFEEGSIRAGVVFYDATGTRLSNEDLFVNQSLDGWTRAELQIVRQTGTPESPSGELLAVGTLTSVAPAIGRFNVDVGDANGTPSSSYGAAGSAGTWNTIGLGTSPLVDTDGLATPVNATLSAFSSGGSASGTPGDLLALLGDNALDCIDPDGWSLAFSALEDGAYQVLLYAPSNANVSTGNVEVNGIAISSLPGDVNELLVEGTSYTALTAQVSGGTLTIDAIGDGVANCAGIAGVQIGGPLPPPPPVPALAVSLRALLCLLLPGVWWTSQRLRGRRDLSVMVSG